MKTRIVTDPNEIRRICENQPHVPREQKLRSILAQNGKAIPVGNDLRYTGHVPCRKCGRTHWMYASCQPEAP